MCLCEALLLSVVLHTWQILLYMEDTLNLGIFYYLFLSLPFLHSPYKNSYSDAKPQRPAIYFFPFSPFLSSFPSHVLLNFPNFIF